MEDLKSVIQESLPDDGQVESSPTPEVKQDVQAESSTAVPEEATSPKAEELPFNEHPRFKQLIEDRNYERQRAERLEQNLQQIVNKLSQPQVAPQVDQYANLTADERLFYENLDKRTQRIVDEKIGREREVFANEIQEAKQTTAALIYKDFLARHPDIQSNSQEENQIAQKVRMGYQLDDAYEVVMGPVKRQNLEREITEKYKKQQQDKTQQKIRANQETSTIPSGSPIQPKVRLSPAEFVDQLLARGGQ